MHKTHIFLQNHIKREVKELFLSVWIQNFAVQMLALFIPIFLYNLGYEIWQIGLYFLITYGTYFFIMPLAAKMAARFGYEHTIAFSMPLAVLFYIALYFVTYDASMFYISAVLYAFAKAFYWVPYHADFASFGSEKQRGRELSIFFVVGQLTIFGAPLIAGAILDEMSFAWLFGIGCVLLLISIIPLFTSKETVYAQKIGYLDCYRVFFSRWHLRRAVTYLAFSEEMIAMTVWPIFIFIIVGDFLTFGGVLTASMVVSSALLLLAGKFTDRFPKERIVQVSSLLYALSWLPKVFIVNPLQAFLSDSLGQFSKTATMIPFSALVYSEAKHNYGKKVVLGAMLFEMGYIPSKIFGCLVIIGISLISDDLRLLLIAGAALSLFYVFAKALPQYKARKA